MLNKLHNAEFFWNRLSALCDDRGTFAIPDTLSKNDEIGNNIRPGAKLIKSVLENTEQQCRLLQEKEKSRNRAGLDYWSREEKRMPDNNKYLLRAINDAVNACTDFKNDELTDFMNTLSPLIIPVIADFDTPDIQGFMLALKKCHENYVEQDINGILYSDHFDLHTRTFTQQLDCSSPSFTDIESFKVLKHIHGDLILNNPNITHLDGLRNVESIKGNLVLNHSGVEQITGLNKLKTANGIELNGMKNLVGICGFNSLSSVSNSINISNNPNLFCINGFNSLNDINSGSLEILANSSLESIHGFNHLKNLNGTLLISKCKKLATLSGLSNLDTVESIFINETRLADISSLRNVFNKQKNFPGYIKITSNHITSVSFMKGLRSVASSFYLHQNRLANLDGLEALETIGASFSLGANQLTDLSRLSKLKKINGILSLSNNRLTTLHGLENLQSLKTTPWNGTPLTIKFQGNEYPDGKISLTDISALSNVKELSGNLIVHVDPRHSYEAMPVQGSTYCSNKVTYLSHQTDETGRILPSLIEIQPIARPAPEEIRIALNNEPFLAWEPAQTERYEFVNAEVFALSEATCQHVTMSLNIAAWLTNHFRISRFRIHMAHIKLYVASANAFLYPDIFVTCSEAVHQAETYMENPLLIVEVLSDATEAYDRGDKFSIYRKISCLREYVLINPDTLRVEIFRKKGTGHWELHELPEGADLELESLELTIPAEILYAYL